MPLGARAMRAERWARSGMEKELETRDSGERETPQGVGARLPHGWLPQPKSWPLTQPTRSPIGGLLGQLPGARPPSLACPPSPSLWTLRPLPPPPPPTPSRMPGGIWGPSGLSPSSPSWSFPPALTVSPRLPLGHYCSFLPTTSLSLSPFYLSFFSSISKCRCLSSSFHPNSSVGLRTLRVPQAFESVSLC